MRYPHIDRHDAQHGVTGSCHQLHMDADYRLLVDCGLFQGNKGRSGAGQHNVEFSLATIKALIVTHVHFDHVGRIPYLLAAGYKGLIFCSEPSAKLLPIVLEDAFKLGFSRDSKEIARYLKVADQRATPLLPYNQRFVLLETRQLCERIRLQRTGHVLGSAYFRIDLAYPATGENIRVVFSGDLGAQHAPLLMPPKRADILVLENTYGDRLHEDRASRRQRLEAVIEHALKDQGTVLIPAFSIGRTQELSTEENHSGVTSVGGYSSHAYQNGLVEFVTGMQQWPTEIPVVRGEQGYKEALVERMKARYADDNKKVKLRR